MSTTVKHGLSHLLSPASLYYFMRSLNRGRRLARSNRLEEARWRAAGMPVPPPACIKQRCIGDYAERYRIEVLVETGTFAGDTVFALRNSFSEIHTIELDGELYRRAARRFALYRHITCWEGDSAAVLPGILAGLSKPTLFWLDGHYSGEGTARGASDTPIVQELARILDRSPDGSVILIDDAREFSGARGYPTVEELKTQVLRGWPSARIEIAEDILRITQ